MHLPVLLPQQRQLPREALAAVVRLDGRVEAAEPHARAHVAALELEAEDLRPPPQTLNPIPGGQLHRETHNSESPFRP